MLTISIRQHSFQLTQRYREGTVLTAGEAQALNTLFSENIRNNMDAAVAAALTGLPPGQLILTKEEHQVLQSRITDYETNYQFPFKAAPRANKSLLDKEAYIIADLATPDDVPDREAAVQALAQQQHIREQAAERVATRQRMLSGGLASL